jgi:isoleucyl-tRNA synthetase
MKERQLHRATRALIQFILEDLSRWYIQLVRPRMWLEGESEAKTGAYETMYYVLRRLCGLLSPFTPHITEMMYENIRTPQDPPSIHMTDWWAGDDDLVDESLERAMDVVRSFDEASANARQAGKRKLRWPVREVVVVTDNEEVDAAICCLSSICEERANAELVRVVRGRFDRSGWRAEPVMKALGPAFGKSAPLVRDLIRAADADVLKSALEEGESVTLTDNNESFLIKPSYVAFIEELPPDLFQAPMAGGTVYVDVTLTPGLEAEGYAREVIRRIQEMRRLCDLNVEDFISGSASIDDERVASLLQGHWCEVIMDEVRAGTFTISAGLSSSTSCAWELEKEWDVEGIPMLIGISKLADQPGKK